MKAREVEEPEEVVLLATEEEEEEEDEETRACRSLFSGLVFFLAREVSQEPEKSTGDEAWIFNHESLCVSAINH